MSDSAHGRRKRKILLVSNTDWYLYNFRLPLAQKLRQVGWDVRLVAPPGLYASALREHGFPLLPFPFSQRGLNPFREAMTLLRLRCLYRRQAPDVVHHFTIRCVLYGSVAAKTIRGLRTVNSICGLGHVFTAIGVRAVLVRVLVKAMYRLALAGNHVKTIFQNSADLEVFVQSQLVRPSKCCIIPGSGVDCDRFRPSPSQRSERNGSVKVLFAARLLREKGVLDYVKVARILKENVPEWTFFLAGDIYPANPSSLTREEVDAIGRRGAVSVLGHVADMPALLDDIDIVVLPTRGEGCPRILVEAAAMQRPIVATDVAGCAAVVKNNVNGFLVPVGDIAAMAKGVERLGRDSELRRSFGEAGRRIVLSHLEEGVVLQKTLEVYSELLETRPPT